MMALHLLAAEAYRYVPFVTPLPMWRQWYLLLLPLCLGISIVYKCIRCNSMSRVPREAAQLFAFILVVMVVTGAVLATLVDLLE